ncbi:DegQ family serine endoprotease [Roseomonas xinghualingensis]|uniref:DegQ family serine endoprotease n=1 Tax=Roseomonas xinghualingensis TaxID=2986475 RepID=UPI0021F0C0D1|nr:DegQ family serine endoprotease [Roseomonas sp. SXEYE001]MCV4207408.1 DegQ family serine endoprotease [Roseomonas sp. SXEYE001]
MRFRTPIAATLALIATMAAAPMAPSLAQTPMRDAPASFRPLAQQLTPAVVSVQVSTAPAARNAQRPDAPDAPQAPPGSPFEEFFRDFLERNRPPGMPGRPGPSPQQRRGTSLGSGFIIDADEKLVVTNNHVVEGGTEINVVLNDNTTLPAELVGTDPRTDIALLRIKTDRPLTAVDFGNSDDAHVGDWVLAIGNPFGLSSSVSAGIISARSRDIRQGLYDDFIQTDAAINRGNSGGPLFDMNGKVIGINTAIYSPSGGSIGIGFAIPSNLARGIVVQLKENGRVQRGWLGVNIQQVTDEIAESLGLKNGSRGALVARAQEDGPAAKGGIRNGDVILRFNNQDVREMRNLPRIVADTRVGSQVPVTVWRDGKEETLNVTVAELPADQAEASRSPAGQSRSQVVDLAGLGLKVGQITPELRERFSLRPDQRGVVIMEVEPGGNAAERDLRPGDVIVEVQQERVNTPQEVQARIEALRRQNRASTLLLIEGPQGQRFVPLRLREEGNQRRN